MKTSLLLTLVSLFITLPASATYEEELEKAKVSLPLRSEAYTQEEIMEKLSPHLAPTIKPFYESSLTLMFSQFGAPKHPVATITGGWQCLLAKATDAEKTPDSTEESQRTALLDLLALHKPLLEKLVKREETSTEIKDLWQLVNAHAPCENCVRSAKHGYGVQDSQTDAAPAAQQTPQTTPSVQPETSTSSTGILTSVLGAIGRAGDVMMTVFRHDSDRYVGTGNF